jgi:phage terminase small subunit
MEKKVLTRNRPLSLRRKLFCKEYVIDFNGRQAAIRAGYSSRRAENLASYLLAQRKVQDEVDRLRRKREERLDASADFVVRELMRIAKFDIRDVFTDSGSLKSVENLSEDAARAIGSIEIDDLFDGHGKDKEMIGYTKKVKAWDKIRALEALGEHFGIFHRPGEREKEDVTKKRMDLLQIIKILSSEDGKKATIIENRFGESQEGSDSMDKSGARGYEVL